MKILFILLIGLSAHAEHICTDRDLRVVDCGQQKIQDAVDKAVTEQRNKDYEMLYNQNDLNSQQNMWNIDEYGGRK